MHSRVQYYCCADMHAAASYYNCCTVTAVEAEHTYIAKASNMEHLSTWGLLYTASSSLERLFRRYIWCFNTSKDRRNKINTRFHERTTEQQQHYRQQLVMLQLQRCSDIQTSFTKNLKNENDVFIYSET